MAAAATAPASNTIDSLAQLMEARLGGMMLVRIGLVELVERFKQEEHALAMSLKTILQLRDEERNAFKAQLESAHAYSHQLEAQLLETQRLRNEAIAAAAVLQPPPPLPMPPPPPAEPVYVEPVQLETRSVEEVAAQLQHQDDGKPQIGDDGMVMVPMGAAPPPAGHLGGANRYAVIGGNAYRHGAEMPSAPDYAAPQPYTSTGVVNEDGAALAPDQVGGYLQRVEQLQQRLAKERISLPAGLEAFPVQQQQEPQQQQQQPPQRGRSPREFDGRGGMMQSVGDGRAPASPRDDAFDEYAGGNLRELASTSNGSPRAMRPREDTPPQNPAVVMRDGEPFVFQHLG